MDNAEIKRHVEEAMAHLQQILQGLGDVEQKAPGAPQNVRVNAPPAKKSGKV